jgi:hypothetical protein
MIGHKMLMSTAAVRPARKSSTICRLNSGAYRTVRFAINTSVPYVEVSTKAGQLQDETGGSCLHQSRGLGRRGTSW